MLSTQTAPLRPFTPRILRHAPLHTSDHRHRLPASKWAPRLVCDIHPRQRAGRRPNHVTKIRHVRVEVRPTRSRQGHRIPTTALSALRPRILAVHQAHEVRRLRRATSAAGLYEGHHNSRRVLQLRRCPQRLLQKAAESSNRPASIRGLKRSDL